MCSERLSVGSGRLSVRLVKSVDQMGRTDGKEVGQVGGKVWCVGSSGGSGK